MIPAELAFGPNAPEPVDKDGVNIVPELTDLITGKFRYALFGDDDRWKAWKNDKCHYDRVQERCIKSGSSHLALPEAIEFFSGYVIKLECTVTSDKSGCCL